MMQTVYAQYLTPTDPIPFSFEGLKIQDHRKSFTTSTSRLSRKEVIAANQIFSAIAAPLAHSRHNESMST
jgi:hypothetical protein